jgi:hypothetical protein
MSQLIVVSSLIEHDFIQGLQTAWKILVYGDPVITEEQIKDVSYANLGLISSMSSVVGILVIVFFIYLKHTDTSSYIPFTFPKLRTVFVFIGVAAILMIFSELMSHWKPNLFDDNFVIESYTKANNLTILYIGVVFLGPIFEEVMFRGFLFKGLAKNSHIKINFSSFLEFFGAPNIPALNIKIPFGGHGAVLVSAILFSVIHLQYGLSVILFVLFPMAILLGYARLISKGITLPILIHSINNLTACLVVHFEIY